METVWSELIKILGVSAIFAGALAWLVKTLLLEGLKREADALKVGLDTNAAKTLEEVRAQAMRELEGFKHSLTLSLEEHKVRFSRLHEMRISALAELYHHCVEVAQSTTYFVTILEIGIYDSADSSFLTRLQEVQQVVSDAEGLLKKASLYLPLELATRVEAFIKHYKGALDGVQIQTILKNETFESITKPLLDLKQPPYSLEYLAKGFRELLGVERLTTL